MPLDTVTAFAPRASLSAFVGHRVVRRHDRPPVLGELRIPTRRDIDAPPLGGAASFGLGAPLLDGHGVPKR